QSPMSYKTLALSCKYSRILYFFFFQAEDGIRDRNVTGVQTCALPIFFVDVPTGIEAYLGVPEDVLAGSPVLTLARSAARRIDSTRRRLHSDDVAELVAATDFDSIVVPGLHGLLSAEAALTADEVTVLTTLEARTHRMNLDTQAALDAIETGRERLRS